MLFDTSCRLVIGPLETAVTFMVGLLMCTHAHARTHTLESNSGEISQEQRYIPEAGSDIDCTWKLSRAECISRATCAHINKRPRSRRTH